MYDHARIDKKWQDKWEAAGAFQAADFSAQEKFYCLIEFPYPSGAGLHTGHPRSYTAMDIVARQARMLGKNVLYPIGWDAFGLPTENYALKTGVAPQVATAENIATFKRQIKSLGLSFDWTREINTTDPAYYKWTQWQFLQFFKHGLAYKKKMPINWCPACKIGLANEEVVNNACERCGGPVEQRDKEQWMIGITKYADRLLADLDTIDFLPKIKKLQADWIGRSGGAEIDFAVVDTDKKIRIFTTRPDTLFGATYLVLAPEHELVSTIVSATQKEAVRQYVAQAAKKSATERAGEHKEKTGVFTGAYALHPLRGEKIPIWVADYVMTGYGTGAIMAVPAHDERDQEFARQNNLPVVQVVFPGTAGEAESVERCLKTLREILPALEDGGAPTWLIGGLAMAFHNGLAYRRARDIDLVCVERNHLATAARVLQKLGWEVRELPDSLVATKKDEATVEINLLANVVLADRQMTRADLDPVSRTMWGLTSKTVTSEFQCALKRFQRQTRAKDSDRLDEEWCGRSWFAETGVAVNSGEFSGLTTAACAEKIIAALTEKKSGQAAVHYKLRDWIFSRQRYWGEPIPLVYCDACAARKQKVLLIHGFEASAESNWFPWIKQQLTEKGFEVFVPTISTAANPEVEQWLAELQPFIEQLSEDDIIVGHSLGSKAALHLVERANKKIGSLILVASAIGELEQRDWEQFRQQWRDSNISALQKFWQEKFSWEKIGSLVRQKTLLLSDDDPFVKKSTHENLPAGWFLQITSGHKHFQEKVAPIILTEILKQQNTGWVALPEKDLPLVLPEIKKYEPTDNGESPLAAATDWVHTTCPRCGGAARRETDTMPNWAGSSWYFLRYADAHNEQTFAAPDKLKYWLPVDLYNGGMEHTTLHLLYSRFWNKFLFDLGYVPTSEPYKRRVSHGLILAADGSKMSKSKGNVVNPDEIVATHGADTLRVYEMFIGPFSEPAPWSTNGVVGVKRFLDRVARLPEKIATQEDTAVTRELQRTVKKITEDIAALNFNTAVAQLMIFVNTVYSAGALTTATWEKFLLVLHPFAPHLTEELWSTGGHDSLLCRAPWPSYDASLLPAETFELVVQINGKVRDRVTVATGVSDEEMKQVALSQPKVKQWLGEKTPRQIVVIPGKLVNLVL